MILKIFKDIEYKIIFFYFLLRSFYVFKSGSLQPFDFLFLGLLFEFLSNKTRKIYFSDLKKIQNYLIFLMYTLVINLIWIIYDNGDFSYFSSLIFYIYNFIFVFINMRLYLKNKLKYKVYVEKAMIMNLLINLLLVFSNIGRNLGFRKIIFFNDPNQMAYYFLMCILISHILNFKRKGIIWLISTYFIFISMSRGSLISLGIFYFLVIIKNIKMLDYKKNILIFVIAISVIGVVEKKYNNEIKLITKRLGENNTNSSFVNRGWDRVLKYPQYIILGAGEGGFRSGEKYSEAAFKNLETHSTWANFILSYGFLGIFLFFKIVFVSRKVFFNNLELYIPFIIHGIIQIDSRQTTFWLFLILMTLKENKKENEKRFDFNNCSNIQKGIYAKRGSGKYKQSNI